jgi:hypothetical protein
MGSMARDPFAPPAEFCSYVETRLPSLVTSTRRYIGNERFADQLARDLLASVAVRWPWYTRSLPGTSRLRRADGRDAAIAADRFLRRAFRESVRDVSDTQQEITLSLDPATEYPDTSAGSMLTGRLSFAEEARLLWEQSALTVRRRTLIAGGLGLMGMLLVVSRSRAQPQAVELEPPASPTPGMTAVPRDVDVLPNLSDEVRLGVRPSPLPPEIELTRAATTLPRGRHALAVFSPPDESSVLLLDDGKLYVAPDIHVRVDNPAALSPDGRYVAYRGARLSIFDVTNGQSRALEASANLSSPVWLDATHLLVSVVGGAQVIDVDGRPPVTLPSDVVDVVVPQGSRPPLSGDPVRQVTELLSIGRPLGAPARVRRYNASGGDPVDVTVVGDLAPWIGLWRGAGYGYGGSPDATDRGLLVRRCQTNGRLPWDLGEPQSALAVVRATTGVVLRILVNTSLTAADRVEPLGWLDSSTVLVSTNSPDASLVLAWRVETGSLQLITIVDRGVRTALADLSVIGR